jgi:hypothetical protein
MKFTKLSLVAALAVSSAFAGGDIAPVEPDVSVASTSAAKTSVDGKLTAYYYTNDDLGFGSKEDSNLGGAVTLDVTHQFTENIAMNFSAVGYANAMDNSIAPNGLGRYFESPDNGSSAGAFLNVANLTATFSDTTFILGRQLLNTPMLAGFDWLLAPGSFEAYTVANSSFENVTLIASYVRTWRVNNTGDEWINLTNIGNGNNWALSAAYDNKTLSGSIWYYNVDAGAAVSPDAYTQIYVDAGYNFGAAKAEAQYVSTNYDAASDSDVYGIRISSEIAGINLMAAYVNVDGNVAGWVGVMDGLYTSSWNTATGGSVGDNFKVEASTEILGIATSVSYAYYQYDQLATATAKNEGSEVDVILGYSVTNDIDFNVVYTNTDYGLDTDGDVNALEVYANYKF